MFPAQSAGVVVARRDVKTVKTALEKKGVFARVVKPWNCAEDGGEMMDDVVDAGAGELFLLHTTVPYSSTSEDNTTETGNDILKTIPGIFRIIPLPSSSDSNPAKVDNAGPSSMFSSALTRFLHSHPPASPDELQILLTTAPKRYSIYSPLLLLPAGSFGNAEWNSYLSTPDGQCLLKELAGVMGVTHVAVNAPIPASSTIRSPSLLKKLFPASWVSAERLPERFEDALWVEATQNGIHQTWAPEFTMFSRGNIIEKARVLSLPNLAPSTEVADFYAGIGYFTFSYLKSGVGRVWAWELNPWSVEALRRGCSLNSWTCRVFTSAEADGMAIDGWSSLPPISTPVQNKVKVPHKKKQSPASAGVKGEVVVFLESNEYATSRLCSLRAAGKAAWVTHVNLGLLPTSRGGYQGAVEVVEVGGWAHVHENVKEGEIDAFGEEVRREMEEMWKIELRGRRGETEVDRDEGEVKLVGVNKVKTFAPGVWHVVYDVQFLG